ncbi:ATP-dependent DNA helicase [hydrothermal vent metagenome]|uniref:ATP-dependent DNA helicase n=1 Tax=hydrothermal vent metagenome TaxID=652676 RepID=A0A1W1DVY7_9ZZZZ
MRNWFNKDKKGKGNQDEMLELTTESPSELRKTADQFGRNGTNKTGKEQQDFDFIYISENTDYKGIKPLQRTKKGLSLTIEELSREHIKILKKCQSENTATALMKISGRKNKTKFKNDILNPLIECGFFELTLPEKPTSPKQKYRFTGKFVIKISKK